MLGRSSWPGASSGMGTSCLISSWQLGPLQHQLGLNSQARPHHRTPDMVLYAGRSMSSSPPSSHLLLILIPSTPPTHCSLHHPIHQPIATPSPHPLAQCLSIIPSTTPLPPPSSHPSTHCPLPHPTHSTTPLPFQIILGLVSSPIPALATLSSALAFLDCHQQ